MKKTCILFFLLLAVGCVFAQNYYLNQRYDFNNHTGIARNIFETDTSYLVVGGANIIVDPYDQTNIAIINIDKSGDTLWRKQYGEFAHNYFHGGQGSMARVPDGGFIMAGGITDSVKPRMALFRFDEQMDTLWHRIYDNSSWQTGMQAKPTPDGGFITIGRTKINDEDGDFWLVKTDGVGNIEWDTTYGGDYYEFGLSIDVCLDGGFIIAGSSESVGSSIGSSTDYYIIKIDSVGNIQWEQVIGSDHNECVWNIEQSKDGGFIVGGCYRLEQYDAYSYLAKLDENGEVEWNYRYDKVVLYNFRELNNGGIIGVGETETGAGLIIKVDHKGKKLWSRVIKHLEGDFSNQDLRDIKPTSDGGFIACGAVFPQPPDTGTQDFWVVKLDSLGCPYPGCDTITGLNEPFQDQYAYSIRNYPNPFSDRTTIETNTDQPGIIAIRDVMGREIAQYAVSQGQHKTVIPASDIGAGLFFYTLEINGQSMTSGKMLIVE